jgi:hypothetical protein
MHVTKYRNREGWTPADVLRLCHATPCDAAHGLVFKFVAKGYPAVAELAAEQAANPTVAAVWRFLTAAHAAQQLLFASQANLQLEARILRCGSGALHHRVDRRNANGEVRVPNALWRAKKAAQRGVR